MDLSQKHADDVLTQGRTGFRQYYVEALIRQDLPKDCIAALRDIPSYIGGVLRAGQMVKVERHVADCHQCRTVLHDLDDLEERIRAAIPPIPAWTRQHVADLWGQLVPVSGADLGTSREPRGNGWPAAARPIAKVAAVGVALLALGGALALAGDNRDSEQIDEAQSPGFDATSLSATDATVPTPGTEPLVPPEPIPPAPESIDSAPPATEPPPVEAPAETVESSSVTRPASRPPATTAAPKRVQPAAAPTTAPRPKPQPTTTTTTSYKLVDLP